MDLTEDEVVAGREARVYKAIGLAWRELIKLYGSPHDYLALADDGQVLLDQALGSLHRLMKEEMREKKPSNKV
jgi:hypothetical protein